MREAKFTKSLTVALPIDDYQKIKQITDDEKISMAPECSMVLNRKMAPQIIKIGVQALKRPLRTEA